MTSHKVFNSPVILDDTMTNAHITRDTIITVKDLNGRTVSFDRDKGETGDEKSFKLTLPKLEKNCGYVITYIATPELPDVYAKVDVSNKAKVTSKNEKDEDFSVEHTAWLNYNKVTLDKSVQADSNTATWTIVVNNPDHLDLGGWRLTDAYHDSGRIMPEQIQGDITVTPNPETGTGSLTISKDDFAGPRSDNDQWNRKGYIFPANSTLDKYTFTYQTDIKNDTGDIRNTGTITPPNGGDSSSGSSTVTKNSPVNLEKTPEGISEDNGNTALTKWKTTITADDDTSDSWTFCDELWDEQYFTKEQLEDIKTAIGRATSIPFEMVAKKYTHYDINTGDHEWNTTSENDWNKDDKYYRFEVTFLSSLSKGQSISFEYFATAVVKDISSKKFGNCITVGDKQVTVHNQYDKATPSIKKHDVYEWNKESTYRDYDNLNSEWVGNGEYEWSNPKGANYSKLLKWDIRTSLNNFKGNTLQIIENLPAGLTLAGMYFNTNVPTNENMFVWLKKDGGTSYCIGSSNYKKYGINIEKDGNRYTITVPVEIVNAVAERNQIADRYIDIRVFAVIDETDYTKWESKNNGWKHVQFFDNKAEVKWGNNGRDSAEQTQTVYKDETKGMVSKSAGDFDQSTGKIPYTIIINPDRNTLLGNGGTELTFQDYLESSYSFDYLGAVSFKLCDVSFKEIKEDGTEEPLKIKYVENESSTTVTEGANRKYVGIFSAKIPDQKKIKISYSYAISAEKADGNKYLENITNTASLTGAIGDVEPSKTTTKVQMVKSKATAHVKGITITKYSSGDGKVIEGAKFTLYEYDSSVGGTDRDTWFVNGTKFTSGKDGVLVKDNGSNGTLDLKELVPNKAYKLVETEAPMGFARNKEPIYFYIESSSTEYKSDMPSDFTSWDNFRIYASGDTVSILNNPVYELPATGSRGTTWIYLLGSIILLLGAEWYLFTHKEVSRK